MLETGIGRALNVHLATLPGFTLPHDLSATKRYFREDIADPRSSSGTGTSPCPKGRAWVWRSIGTGSCAPAPGAAPGSFEEGRMRKAELARLIDHTALGPDVDRSRVEKLCQEAIQHGFYAVCVPPTSWGSPSRSCATAA